MLKKKDDLGCLGCISVAILVVAVIAFVLSLSLGIAYGMFLLVRWFSMFVGLDKHTSTILGIVAAVISLLGGARSYSNSKNS